MEKTQLSQDEFKCYLDDLADKRVILLSRNVENGFKCIKPRDSSRYFEKGRNRIKARLRQRIGPWYNKEGVILTLTFDPKKIGFDEAWAYVGKFRREFLNALNMKRKEEWKARKKAHPGKYGKFHKLKFLSVLEEQKKKTHYPHIHIVFPGLYYLESNKYLTDLWGHGWADARYHDTIAPASYLCKYISKMDSWSLEAQNVCWVTGTRLYSLSRDYADKIDKKLPEWKFYKVGDSREIALWYLSKNHLLQRMREGPVPYPLTYLDQSSYDALLNEAGLN